MKARFIALSFSNLTASAFPAACRGVSERIQTPFSLQIEDSPPLAAGSFNYNDFIIQLALKQSKTGTIFLIHWNIHD